VGATIRSEARQRIIGSLKEGEVFVLPRDGGYLVGMIGTTAEERTLIVLGSQGTAWDDQGMGWIGSGGGEISEELAFVIPNARLELTRGPLGYPEPDTIARNGTVIVDEDGVEWLATHRGTSRPRFRLSDGASGTPVGRLSCYNSWRVVWQPDDTDEIIELLASRP
jgi:hypothetical protein